MCGFRHLLGGLGCSPCRQGGYYCINQSMLKEISPGCSLEGLMLKLKLQYFDYLMWRVDSFEKTLMLGKIEGRRRRDDRGWDGWMASPTQWTWVWMDSGSWWWTGRPVVHGAAKSQTRLSNWTELKWTAFTLEEVSCSLSEKQSLNQNWWERAEKGEKAKFRQSGHDEPCSYFFGSGLFFCYKLIYWQLSERAVWALSLSRLISGVNAKHS